MKKAENAMGEERRPNGPMHANMGQQPDSLEAERNRLLSICEGAVGGEVLYV